MLELHALDDGALTLLALWFKLGPLKFGTPPVLPPFALLELELPPLALLNGLLKLLALSIKAGLPPDLSLLLAMLDMLVLLKAEPLSP